MIIQRHKRGLTRNINNTAGTFSRDHPTRHMLGDQHRAARIDRHHAIETLPRGIHGTLKQSNPSTIHQPIKHIKRTKSIINRPLIAHIEHQRLAARFLRQPRKLIHITRRSNHICTSRTQRLDSGPPNPARSPRHKNRAPRKIKSHIHDDRSRYMTGFNAG